MWKPIQTSLFIACTTLFLFNQLLEAQGIYLPFVHAYLDDLLVMPIFFSITLTGMRLLYQNPHGRLSKIQIILGTLWIALLFEGIFPLYKENHYADPWDVLAYAIGAAFFYLFAKSKQMAK